ncbi:MAG: hypothetical protein WA814_11840, partial [Candidatus Baltobacteraceae bacterium]
GVGGPGGVGGVGGAGGPGRPGGPGGAGNGNRPGGGGNGNNVVNGGGGNTIVNNPVYGGGGYYGWNGGMAWGPAPYYWGGGFWGAMAIGVTSAAVYGAVVDEGVTYNSYEVQSNTPGATFLETYQLVQVQCGPPGLVVVYGPENSVICANPNANVGQGSYRLDTVTLSLIPANGGGTTTPATP